MSVPAHLKPIDQPQGSRRGVPRFVLSLGSTLGPDGSSATIHDLSSAGLRLETAAHFEVGDTLEVELPLMGAAETTVIWRDGPMFGCQFAQPIPRAAVSAALLRSEPSASDQPGSPELEQRAPGALLRRLTIIGIAALIIGGVTYFLFTAGVVALVILATVLVLLLALLVRWGFWVLDNTR